MTPRERATELLENLCSEESDPCGLELNTFPTIEHINQHSLVKIESAILEAEAEGWRRCQNEIAGMIEKSVDYWITYGPSQAPSKEYSYEMVVSVLRGLRGDIVAAIEKKEKGEDR